MSPLSNSVQRGLVGKNLLIMMYSIILIFDKYWQRFLPTPNYRFQGKISVREWGPLVKCNVTGGCFPEAFILPIHREL